MDSQRIIPRSPKANFAPKPLPERRSTRARKETAKAREARILREIAAKVTKSRMSSPRHDSSCRKKRAAAATATSSQANVRRSRRTVASSPLSLVDGSMRDNSVTVEGNFDVTMKSADGKTYMFSAHHSITGKVQVGILAAHQEASGALTKATQVKDGRSTSDLQNFPEESRAPSPNAFQESRSGDDGKPGPAKRRPVPLPMPFRTEDISLEALWKEAFRT
ncbi:MAG: hypothetical protein Q9160_003056 [Pyrenula sp. 1 TL-2023]